MSRFLRFISSKALDGQSDDLKEYAIALEVFDKDDSFDPRIDPVVRSEARRLRAKLAEYYETADGDDKVLIELPKGAYAPIFLERPSNGAASERSRAIHPRYLVIALVASLTIAVVAWWLGRRPSPRPVSRSIAVLPFENLTADPANEYFADGLTEEILNALANAPGLKVVARTSAFEFKGKHEDIRSIGKKLDAGLVLEGSVRKDGDRMRITPQLINVVDGYHVWSAEYDRESKDLFAIQREIATAIVGVLGGQPGHAPPQPLDAETYRLYLEGRYHFNKWNSAGMQKAIPLFEKVVERDPKYAPAYASLSGAYGLLAAFGGDASPAGQSKTKARRAALKAIELDPNSSDAWSSLAPHLAEDFDWPATEGAFRKALELNPNSSDAHAWYSELYLTPMGRLDEALRESQAAQALDPISPYTLAGVGKRYYFLRQYDSAIAWLQKALDLEPRFSIAFGPMVHAYMLKGDRPGARRFLESAKVLWPARGLALLSAELLAAEGNSTEALQLLSDASPQDSAGCQVAGIYVALGKQIEAISWLDRAIESRSACFQVIPVDPLFESLHANAGFAALLRKMKLNH
ncbi:MAG TPA: tetratricopeptide repeat protein [Bryobacteraceae bacterium]|nr:tetratricopeptide repeat protein [Bryobacteraceae bacterium]